MRAKGIYLVPGALILAMLLFLLIFAGILIRPVVGGTLDLLSVVAAVFGVLLCLPLSILSWRSSKNEALEKIFKSLSVYFFLMCASAILWFAVPVVFDAPWALIIAKILMLAAYAPVLQALYYLVRAKKVKEKPYVNFFIVVTSALAAIVILIFVLLNYYRAPGNAPDVTIFTLSIIADIAIMAFSAVLAINYAENHLRYVFTAMIVYFLMTFAGDCVSISYYLGIYDMLSDAYFFYDMMAIFAAIALLAFLVSNVKITTVEEVNKQLHDTRNLMHDLIMQSPDAICIFDLDGGVLHANRSFLRFTGKDTEAAISQLNLFRDADRIMGGLAETIAKVRRGETVIFEGTRPPLIEQERARHYSIKIFPTLSPRGAITSYIIIATDITEQKSHEDELQSAKNEAELYLDLMGHDINNMHQIALGYLELAQDRIPLDESQKPLLDRPSEALRRSARLIDNVRKLQKLRSGVFFTEPVDVNKILTDVIKDFEAVPGKTITFSCDENTPSLVMANELLREVFANLIGNAIKYADRGHASISVRLERVAENGSYYCRVTVEDDGPGIPDDLKEKIFNRMSRGTSGTKGMGLGLYLVKKLVESYGGKVWVEDRMPGDHTQGAKFLVILPAVAVR